MDPRSNAGPRTAGDGPEATPVASSHSLPGWLTLAYVWRGAAALVATVAAACGLLAWSGWQEAVEDSTHRGELFASVLTDHLARTIDTSAVALGAVAALVGGRAGVVDPIQLGPTLSQSILALPSLRSVAVLDPHGRVLASSSMEDVDEVVDLARFGPLPPRGHSGIGRLVRGRHLRDAAVGAAGDSPVQFLPVLRHVVAANGQALWLVGLLNPDGLANYQRLALSEGGGEIVWTARLDHELVAVGGDDRFGPGQRVEARHPVWSGVPGERSHGTAIGPGLDGRRRMISFRAVHEWPLVVAVEQPMSGVWQVWWRGWRYPLAISLVAGLFIVGLAHSAARNLRVRLAARRDVEQAQARLEQRERELSVVVRSVQELIFRTDADGIVRFVNDRWSSLAPSTGGDPIGRSLAGLMAPAWRAGVQALFEPRHADGVRTTHAVLDRDPRSTEREIRLDLAVVPLHADGRITGFAGSAVDVSERWQVQQQLRQQLDFTESLLEISPLPVSMVDVEGRCLMVNRAWCEFFGRSRVDALGRRTEELMPAGEAAAHRAQDRRVIAGGQRLRYVSKMLHGDGSWRDVVLTKVAVRRSDGRLVGVLCTLMDVSEFREAERVTREARDLAEEASRAKSEFIANVSHELRTPLQSILGFSEIGMQRSQAHDRFHAMFVDVQAAGQRMLALVNDLLDVARLDSTVGTFHLERADLRLVIRPVARELAPQLERQQLHLALGLGDVPLIARVDPLRFQQVIRNVLANAIRFAPAGTGITLDARPAGEGLLEIVVRDHGPGIPPAELESIFEAFVQSSATRDGSGGTGLGLAICRKIVAAHGGRIGATNAPDGGAVFRIELPAAAVADTPVGA